MRARAPSRRAPAPPRRWPRRRPVAVPGDADVAAGSGQRDGARPADARVRAGDDDAARLVGDRRSGGVRGSGAGVGHGGPPGRSRRRSVWSTRPPARAARWSGHHGRPAGDARNSGQAPSRHPPRREARRVLSGCEPPRTGVRVTRPDPPVFGARRSARSDPTPSDPTGVRISRRTHDRAPPSTSTRPSARSSGRAARCATSRATPSPGWPTPTRCSSRGRGPGRPPSTPWRR